MDSRLGQLQTLLAAALADFSAEEMAWHPPGKWCGAELLEHLFLTYTGTVKGLEKVLALGKPFTARRSLKQRVQTFAVVSLGYLPEGRKAPARTTPLGMSAEVVRAGIESKIAAMDEILTRCEGQFGANVALMDHPILGPLTAAQWRKFHLVHGKLHIRQMRRLKKSWSARGSGRERL